MKHSRVFSASLGILLGSGLLIGCGPREAEVTPTPTAPAGETPPTNETPDEDTAADTTDTTTEDADTTDSGGVTSINPPKSANLTAQQANAQINLRSRPTTESTAKGYGLVGDPVELLRATEGEDNLTWYYVKFDESGAEGWIRGDFIRTAGTTASLQQGANVDIDSFTTDELFGVGSGGCGMTLWPVGDRGEYLFFNGLPDTGMWMKLDGDMTEFRRTDASGPEFYGQAANQTFVSPSGQIEVNVTVDVGDRKGMEAVNIDQGTLRLAGPAGGVTEVAVEGDAGC
jgi:hypothetical protein